jgi:peptidoglycan-associated lipoprotein
MEDERRESMRIRTGITLVAMIALVALVSTSCVTGRNYREGNEKTNARINSAESGIESNERRISDLGRETDEALDDVRSKADGARSVGDQAMAQANQATSMAEKAARGKLLWSVTLSENNLKFEFGQSGIPGEAGSTLDDLIDRIKDFDRAVYVLIEGYTDNTGPEQYNHDLGLERAGAIRDYLFENGGIPLHAMNTYSFGEEDPVADNSTREGRAQNRRVVVKVLE